MYSEIIFWQTVSYVSARLIYFWDSSQLKRKYLEMQVGKSGILQHGGYVEF